MITAKESKQAAKGRMQMYQPAQRLARGNAGGYIASLILNINDNERRSHEKPESTEPNGELLMITVEMLMLMIVMVMKN